jgi:hypothetical protein
MNLPIESASRELQLFEPDLDAVYTIELTQVWCHRTLEQDERSFSPIGPIGTRAGRNRLSACAGVRELERGIGAVCCAIAARFAKGETREITVTPEIVQTILGPTKYIRETKLKTAKPGVVTGLA